MPERKSEGRIVCRALVFKPAGGRGVSTIHSRYGMGRLEGSTLFLNEFELLFLYRKAIIKPENPLIDDFGKLCDSLIGDDRELDLLRVYSHFREKGFRVIRNGNDLVLVKKGRPSSRIRVTVWTEKGKCNFNDLSSLPSGFVALLDGQGDVTLFSAFAVDPRGKVEHRWPESVRLKTLGESSIYEGNELPEWFGQEFNGLKILEQAELEFLAESGVYEKSLRSSRNGRIFADLVRRKFIVKTGFKYGAAYRAYETGMNSHAELLVHDLTDPEEWYKISRAVRVSHAVRKRMIFCNLSGDDVSYLEIRRVGDNEL